MMKKSAVVLAMVLLILTFCSCGLPDASITADWTLVEMTVNGETDTGSWLATDELAPKFSTPDAQNFTFTTNGKTRTGTITQSGNVYTLHYAGTDKTMEAVLEGRKLTLTLGTTVKLVFEAK